MRCRLFQFFAASLLGLQSAIVCTVLSAADQSVLSVSQKTVSDDAGDVNRVAGLQRTVLVIHGGAGVLDDDEMKKEGLKKEDYEQALRKSLAVGFNLWKQDKSSVEVVEAAIRIMEDCELFNAGKGAAFNSDGRVELDAAIMEGDMTSGDNSAKSNLGKLDPRKRAGAVAAVSHVKNPISAARAVMEIPNSRHVMLVGEGAEVFVLSDENRQRYKIERVSNLYFWTDRRVTQIRSEFQKGEISVTQKDHSTLPVANTVSNRADHRFGTVGAVSVSKKKKIAVGTSTGGLANKLPGRLGDSPIIGAGTYADDRACGVSCTGTGEVFIRHAVAHDVVARMLYGRKNIADAVEETLDAIPDEEGGVGGLIALSPEGKHAFGFSKNSVGLYRGWVTEAGEIYVAVFKGDNFTRFTTEEAQKSGK